MRDTIDKKLDELLSKGIIEEIPNIPTEWVSSLVVVPKPDEDIRVCVDMRKVNEAIVRERPHSNNRRNIVFNRSTVFRKLDLKWVLR